MRGFAAAYHSELTFVRKALRGEQSEESFDLLFFRLHSAVGQGI